MTTDRQDRLENRLENRQTKTLIPTAPLPDPISQSIDAVIALHTKAERDLPRHQRILENMTSFFGRPAFLYISLLVVTLWLVPNLMPLQYGLPRFDPPPFNWLELSFSIGSFFMTIGVLIAQKRQEKMAEQRAQLSLQLNLLSEQKIAKVIALLEELRHDLPNVKNRLDMEAEVMKQAADPEAVLLALEETLAEELVLQKQVSEQEVESKR